MRTAIETYDGLGETLGKLGDGGLFLMTGAQGNPMTIGWATVGVIWGLPILTILVRPSRHSFSLVNTLPEFTVNVPGEKMGKALAVCGSKSGRDMDKMEVCGMTAVASKAVAVPCIDECIVHYECRVVHTTDVINSTLSPEIVQKSYPSGDLHRIYHGEILGVYRNE